MSQGDTSKSDRAADKGSKELAEDVNSECPAGIEPRVKKECENAPSDVKVSADAEQATSSSGGTEKPSPQSSPAIETSKVDDEPTSKGWGWGSASAITGWGWSTLSAAATTATTLSKKLEDIVMIPNEDTAEAVEAEEASKGSSTATSFWDTDEIRFITKIATGTVSVTTKLADKGLEALGSGIETIGTGLSTVTQVLPLATPQADPTAEAPAAPSLQELASDHASRLDAMPAALQDKAKALGVGLADEVQAEQPTSSEATQCSSLPFGGALLALESSAKATCTRLEGASDAAATLNEITQAAADASAELVALAKDQLGMIACALDTGIDLKDLLPGWTTPTNNDEYAPSALKGLRVIMLFTLSLLGRICGAYSGVAAQLTTTLKKRARTEKTKEAEELAARARAVKGEVYVLQGSSTTTLIESLEQVLTVLRAVSVRDPDAVTANSESPS